jgi:hypothetical protein
MARTKATERQRQTARKSQHDPFENYGYGLEDDLDDDEEELAPMDAYGAG